MNEWRSSIRWRICVNCCIVYLVNYCRSSLGILMNKQAKDRLPLEAGLSQKLMYIEFQRMKTATIS